MRKTSALALLGLSTGVGFAQEALPTIEVGGRRAPSQRAAPVAPQGETQTPAAAAADASSQQLAAFQDRLLPPAGADASVLSRSAILALPQADNLPLDKVLLRTVGASQDSSVNGGLHIRNEHSNLQYRINGVLMPDGVAGFGQVIETGFIDRLSLLTGALPAQYGLRTSGVIDIVSRTPGAEPSGGVSIYGGSRDTVQTTFDFAQKKGPYELFTAGRLLTDTLGINNTTPSHDAIHDRTRQGRFFGYAAYAPDDATRVMLISGVSIGKFQIPNTPGQLPQFTAFGVGAFDSAALNENQIERSYYNVLALAKSEGRFDGQISAFSRESSLHYTPDPLGDLIFNGVASNVYRRSFINGAQGDAAWRADFGHTLRGGFMVAAERSKVVNSSTLFPLDADGEAIDAPYGVSDASGLVGWTYSAYAQDEWKLSDRLTLNAGLRFDHMAKYVSASQLSPRVGLVFQPIENGTLHAGYARYFTPPAQAQSAPVNLALVENTTLAPQVALTGPVRPERSNYLDIGYTHRFTPQFEAGVAYYLKRAQNLLDNGQFGQALALSAFNYDRGYNTGVELKASFAQGDFTAFGNLAWGRQRGRRVSSNYFLIEADELAYIADHYVYTDHAQTWSGSAGLSHVVFGTRVSADVIFGSGLRAGFANTQSLPGYAQVNLGLSREIGMPYGKPVTLRFDVVNLFDHSYVLRDGTGIGVFAPQYGPRRGFFAGLRQSF